MCEDTESVSHYRRCGALTALLINKSPFSPSNQPYQPDHSVAMFRDKTVLWLCLKYEHGGMYGELMEELRERGGEVLTPFVLFLQR